MILNFAVIPSIIITPSCISFFPIIANKLDPTYFWFRDIAFFSTNPKMTMLLRMMIIFLTVLHGNILLNDIVITYINIVFMFDSCLKTLTKCGRILNYFKNLKVYRQLQITNLVTEELMAAFLLTIFICSVMMGYLVVKLHTVIPINLVFVAIVFILFNFGFCHILLPLGFRVTAMSERFIKNRATQKIGKLQRKWLKSCRILRLRVGSYTMLTKTFRTNYVAWMVFHTIDLIMLM